MGRVSASLWTEPFGKGRRKASPERLHPQFPHSVPAQASASAFFPWHKHLDFSKSWCQGFSWRKSCIYWAGKEGGLPQQPFSMWPLCCSAAQARTLQELWVPAETLQRGGHRDISSSQGCSSTPDWLPRLRSSSSFPSVGPEVVTQGHLLFNIPTRGWEQPNKWQLGRGHCREHK